MDEITVAVIGGAGFLGQHIVRELQIWDRKQRGGKRRRNFEHNETSRCHGNERPRQVSINLSSCESDNSSMINLETDDTDDTYLLEDNDHEDCNFLIKEIRVLDIKPFDPVFEFSECPPITPNHCDIRCESQVSEKLEGINVAIHCAASVLQTIGNIGSEKGDTFSFWETNLEGTENVIWGCRKADVRALIYTSTIGAVIGGKKLLSRSATLTPVVDETKLLFGTYGRSRRRAEDIVLNAHKTHTANDGLLLTTVLRPVALYGEGDTRFIPFFIDMAQGAGGKLPPLGGPFAHHQLTYAGNAAFAHVCAMIHLLNGSTHPLRDCGGLSTYICDDSPTGTSDEVLSPFLSNFGLSTTPATFPFFAVVFFTFVVGLWVSFWEKIGWPSRWRSALPSSQLQILAGTTTVVSRTKAEFALHFRPKYTWKESRDASISFYEKLVDNKVTQRLGY